MHELLNNIAEIRSGLAITDRVRDRSAAELPCIGVANVTEAGVTTKDRLDRERIRLTPRSRGTLCVEGDVLVVARGTVLRAALVGPEQSGALVSANLLLVRPDQDRLLPQMLLAYLRSPGIGEKLRELARSSSGQLSLSAGRLGTLRIPVPPLPLQRQISELEDTFSTYQRAAFAAVRERRSVVDGIIRDLLTEAHEPGHGSGKLTTELAESTEV